jgi:hypothetical protein
MYIKLLLLEYFNIPDLYYSDYNSKINKHILKKTIYDYEKAKYGIIANVYCLGEGYDNPMIDAVVFAENMSSNIRIVQSALRGTRKNQHEPDKITKIILPILNKTDWLENRENPDFKKVREVIFQMGLEDETISEKIKILKINVRPYNWVDRPITNIQFGTYEEDLTKILKLKAVHRLALGITYDKAKKILADKQIQSKAEYLKYCESDARLPVNPVEMFQDKFINWIDYLGIEKVYYDLETCRNKTYEYLIKYPNIKKYTDYVGMCFQLCKLDQLFPPVDFWTDYYNVSNLQDTFLLPCKKQSISMIV